MAIFNFSIDNVQNTKIFVSNLTTGKQITIFENEVITTKSNINAMILPVYVEPNETIQLFYFDKFPNFFSDIENIFKFDSSIDIFKSSSSDISFKPIANFGGIKSDQSNLEDFSKKFQLSTENKKNYNISKKKK
jgi:hypothetical protein